MSSITLTRKLMSVNGIMGFQILSIYKKHNKYINMETIPIYKILGILK